MINDRSRIARFGLAAGLCTGVLALAFAQPQERTRTAFDPPPIDREQLRERLASRLERTRASCESLENAITRLDNNEEPGAILVALGPALRDELSFAHDPSARGRPLITRDGAGLDHNGPVRMTVDPQVINEFIDRELPWLAERLNRAEAERPGSRLEMIVRIAPQIDEILNTSQDNPELARLHIEQFRLGAELMETMRRVRRAVDAGEMTEDSARSAIFAVASHQVDLRERITRSEIESLRARLAEREAELDAQIADRDRVIANMTERIYRRWFDMRRDGTRSGPRRDDDKREHQTDDKSE